MRYDMGSGKRRYYADNLGHRGGLFDVDHHPETTTGRHKKIEVDVWEKTLDVMQQKIVVPLTNRIDNLQAENEKVINRLNYLQNAINKMYYCRTLNNCPIRYELRKQKTDCGESFIKRGNPAHRQRAPDNDDHNPPPHYTPGDGEIELEPP